MTSWDLLTMSCDLLTEGLESCRSVLLITMTEAGVVASSILASWTATKFVARKI